MLLSHSHNAMATLLPLGLRLSVITFLSPASGVDFCMRVAFLPPPQTYLRMHPANISLFSPLICLILAGVT